MQELSTWNQHPEGRNGRRQPVWEEGAEGHECYSPRWKQEPKSSHRLVGKNSWPNNRHDSGQD